jgi:hypothetical protein
MSSTGGGRRILCRLCVFSGTHAGGVSGGECDAIAQTLDHLRRQAALRGVVAQAAADPEGQLGDRAPVFGYFPVTVVRSRRSYTWRARQRLKQQA